MRKHKFIYLPIYLLKSSTVPVCDYKLVRYKYTIGQRLGKIHTLTTLILQLYHSMTQLGFLVINHRSLYCVLFEAPLGAPLFPLVHLLPHLFPFSLFPFFHWLYLFSSFVHPFPFYQNSPTPFPGRRSFIGGDQTWV